MRGHDFLAVGSRLPDSQAKPKKFARRSSCVKCRKKAQAPTNPRSPDC
jgi:hypothetical protein